MDHMDVDGGVRIQILSDLHLEFPPPRHVRVAGPYQYGFPAKSDTLALLGDIGLTAHDGLFQWLQGQLTRFKTVLFLSGNHEFYGSSLEESKRKLADFETYCDRMHKNASAQAPFGRFILLDRKRHDLSDTLTILGCTLWSRIDPAREHDVQRGLNDFHQIAGLTPALYASLHERDRLWLERSLAAIARDEPHRRVVVMTHHAPTEKGTSDPRYADSAIRSAFSTELVGGPCWRAPPLKVWAFGHTHWPCDFECEGVRVLSNPKGYAGGTERGFVPGKVIEV